MEKSECCGGGLILYKLLHNAWDRDLCGLLSRANCRQSVTHAEKLTPFCGATNKKKNSNCGTGPDPFYVILLGKQLRHFWRLTVAEYAGGVFLQVTASHYHMAGPADSHADPRFARPVFCFPRNSQITFFSPCIDSGSNRLTRATCYCIARRCGLTGSLAVAVEDCYGPTCPMR